MSPRARRRIRVTVVILLIVVILLLLSRCSLNFSEPENERPPGGGGDRSGTGYSLSFTVSGDTLRPISPGVSEPIDLVLFNDHDDPLVVTRLSLSISEVIAPRSDEAHPCTAADFTLTQSANHIVVLVPGRGSATLSSADIAESDWPRVGMTKTSANQDGCKGSSLRFDHTATGRRDHQ